MSLLGKVTFTFAIFASCFCYGCVEQREKEPNVSAYLVPPMPRGKGLTEERPQVMGGVRVLMARLRAVGFHAGSQLMSCPSRLMESGQIFSRARAMPFQPVVDGDHLDNTNNEQHIIFGGCTRTRQDLCQISSPCQGVQVFLCVRAEN